MRLLVAALVLSFAVAVTASVFAIWPVVADAPWERDISPPGVSQPAPTQDLRPLRCQAALDWLNQLNRLLAVTTGPVSAETIVGAHADVDKYCGP
jgi:hypothetical protein